MNKNILLPSMVEREKELRMMGFVPYNISPMAAGIQFGHAVVEYGLHYGNDSEYIDFAKNYKTFIILNGGTTNSNKDSVYYGSMDKTLEYIKNTGVLKVAEFREPDLNDALSAFVFIADEKLFDHNAYPMLEEYQKIRYCQETMIDNPHITLSIIHNQETLFEQYREEYMEIIGGEDRYEIKKILKQARLATN